MIHSLAQAQLIIKMLDMSTSKSPLANHDFLSPLLDSTNPL